MSDDGVDAVADKVKDVTGGNDDEEDATVHTCGGGSCSSE